MIKKVLETLLICMLAMLVNYCELIEETNKQLDVLFNKIERECIKYELYDELYLIFDYEAIEENVKSLFQDKNVEINIESYSAFVIKVSVNIYFMEKEIVQKYKIEKGEIYESSY